MNRACTALYIQKIWYIKNSVACCTLTEKKKKKEEVQEEEEEKRKKVTKLQTLTLALFVIS